MNNNLNRRQRNEAGALSLALQWGYAELSEASDWADNIIESSTIAVNGITNVALATSVSDAISALNQVSSEFDAIIALKLFLKRFNNVDSMSPESASKLAKYLYFLAAYDDEYDNKDFSCFVSHWDAIDLARDGSFGDTEETISDFLKDIKKTAASLSSY